MSALRTVITRMTLVLAGAGAGAGVAEAAPPWSAPLDIGPPSNGAEVVGLGFSSRGDGLVGWRLGQSSVVAALRGDGSLVRSRPLPLDLAAGPALTAGPPPPARPEPGRAIVVMRRLLPPGPKPAGQAFGVDRTRLSWALVTPSGTVGRVRALATENCLLCQVKLAVNWRGDAIAVWREGAGATRAAYRRAGAGFGTPATIFGARDNGDYPDLAAAIGADGRAIVVDAGAVVRARVYTRDGRFGRAMTVGRGDGSVRASAALSNGGDAIVAWGSQDAGEEANEPWIVRAARLRRGATRFSAAQTLDGGAGISRPEGRIALAFTPGGRATIAWSAVGSQNMFPVMAAAAERGGRFAAPQRLAPSGAVGSVAVRPDGAAVVAWSQLAGPQQPIAVFASVRPAGAVAFGAPEALSGPAFAFFAPLVAFHPLSGRPTAGWGARPDRMSPAGVVDDSLVHLTTRTGP